MPDTCEELVTYLKQRGALTDERIINAFHEVSREDFVPNEYVEHAYKDTALPIKEGQTISAPHMVAHMTELLDPRPDDRVLEIGAGSGYQAAILSHLVDQVITVEIVEELAEQACGRLESYENVIVITADGSTGCAEHAPYDKILYAAAAPHIPETVFDQLAEDGTLVAPIGSRQQSLNVYTKKNGKVTEETHYGVRFVPLTGEEGIDRPS